MPLPPANSEVCRRRFAAGITRLSFVVLVAALSLTLAFVVALARHVRTTSADELTRERIIACAEQVRDWLSTAGTLDLERPVLSGSGDEEAYLRQFAMNQGRAAARSSGRVTADLTGWRDAWGTPLLLLAGQHSQLGIAPGDAPFLLSAGPDRTFLSKSDNLYSYDQPAGLLQGQSDGAKTLGIAGQHE
jgi:hypothetical protein